MSLITWTDKHGTIWHRRDRPWPLRKLDAWAYADGSNRLWWKAFPIKNRWLRFLIKPRTKFYRFLLWLTSSTPGLGCPRYIRQWTDGKVDYDVALGASEREDNPDPIERGKSQGEAQKVEA
jgi:hypothetical protein